MARAVMVCLVVALVMLEQVLRQILHALLVLLGYLGALLLGGHLRNLQLLRRIRLLLGSAIGLMKLLGDLGLALLHHLQLLFLIIREILTLTNGLLAPRSSTCLSLILEVDRACI